VEEVHSRAPRVDTSEEGARLLARTRKRRGMSLGTVKDPSLCICRGPATAHKDGEQWGAQCHILR